MMVKRKLNGIIQATFLIPNKQVQWRRQLCFQNKFKGKTQLKENCSVPWELLNIPLCQYLLHWDVVINTL